MTPSLAVAPQRRAYDHRLREQVCRTGSHALSCRLEIPHSTIATWKRRGLRPVVSVEMFEADRHQLLRTIEKLEKRAQILAATVRLLLALARLRVPSRSSAAPRRGGQGPYPARDHQRHARVAARSDLENPRPSRFALPRLAAGRRSLRPR